MEHPQKNAILEQASVSCVLSLLAAFGPLSREEIVERADLFRVEMPGLPTEEWVRIAVSDLLGLGMITHCTQGDFQLKQPRPPITHFTH